MKKAIPPSTSTATIAISTAEVPLRPEPLVELVLVCGTVAVAVDAVGTVAGETGTPGASGLVALGGVGVMAVEVLPAASAPAGPLAGNAIPATSAIRPSRCRA